MSYIMIGKIKAKHVHAKEPVKLINSPNLGTIIAIIAVKITARVLMESLLVIPLTPLLEQGKVFW
jgi:hypothetical protein